MIFNKAVTGLKKLTANIDWQLLVFLVLFLNIKLPVKLLALVFIYVLNFNFKFGYRLKNSRLPLFYPAIILIAVLGLILNQNYQYPHYMMVFFTGIGFWLVSLLAIHQVKLAVERNSSEVIYGTLVAFFVLNAIVSLIDLGYVMLITHSINPYTFRGLHQAYFINTGDDIKGISFDISSTNAVLNALGVIYFLSKEKPVMLVVCICTLLLTFSNLITLILLVVLLLLLLFKSTRAQKSMILICLMLLVIFMVKISPENERYATQNLSHHILHTPITPVATSKPPMRITDRPDFTLTKEGKREKTAQLYVDSLYEAIKLHTPLPAYQKYLPKGNNGAIFIPKPHTTQSEYNPDHKIEHDQQLMLDFIAKHHDSLPLSSQKNYNPHRLGKLTGMIQSLQYLNQHPFKLIAGTGIGNFSSKIAFRATGLGIRGKYPAGKTYISHDFLINHLDLYMSYFSKEVGYRSVMNNPYSVYDQLLTEYGLLGLLALIVLYLGYFIIRLKWLTYGIAMLLFVLGIFVIDYWFEQLSVMVLFELMLFLNLKENDHHHAC